MFDPIGVTGLDQFGYGVWEEFLPSLQYPQACKVYKEMSDNDPTIGAIMYTAKQLIRKSTWTVKAISDKATDKAAAQFVEECMNDMSMTWAATITEILSELIYGFSFHEIVYKVRRGNVKNPKFKSKYNDGRIGWRKIPIRAQSSLFGWRFDEKGEVQSFIQQAVPNFDLVDIPLSKGLLFRTEVTRNNPEGRSLLRNAYRPWYFKKRIEEIEGIGIERDLAGLPTLILPENVDIWNEEDPQSKKLQTMALKTVQNIKRDTSEGVVLPFGWELKLLSTGGSRQFDTNAIINRYDQRIAITMLSDIVMMGGDKVGSFALGKVKQSLLSASLEALIRDIADVFNFYAIPPLFELNGMPLAEYPKIQPGEIEVPDLKDIAFIMRAGGLDITKDLDLMNMVRELISINPMTPEEFKKIYGITEEAAQQSKPAEQTEQAPQIGTSAREKSARESKNLVTNAMNDTSSLSK